MRSLYLFSGLGLLAVEALEPWRNLGGATSISLLLLYGGKGLYVYHPSSPRNMPKLSKNTLVPGGHFSAGTAAETSKLAMVDIASL